MPAGRSAVVALVLVALLVPAAAPAARADAGRGDPAAPGPLGVAVTVNGLAAGATPGPEFESGTVLAWAYDVTNLGPDFVWALYLWHDGVGAATCPDRALAAGETVRCTAAETAAPGTSTSLVSAWAWDEAGATVSGQGVAYYTGVVTPVPPAPSLDLEAFAGGRDADVAPGLVVQPGKAIAYRYRVRNTGNVTLWGLWVRDAVLGDINCPSRVLAPGEKVVCAARAIALAGPHASTAQAHAWDAAGTEVADQDLLRYTAVWPHPAVGIEALTEGFDGDNPPGPRVRKPGGIIHFSYVVTNLGGARLTDVWVVDDALGAVACPRAALAIGQSMVCRATTIGALGEFVSAGRVTASAGASAVNASDPIYYHVREHPRIHRLALEVSVNGVDADDVASAPSLTAGSPVQFVYLVTYTGNNRVYRATIQDPNVPAEVMACTGSTTLDRGGTLRCTATVPAVAGPYSSVVTVVSWDPDGRRISATDSAHYLGVPR